MYIYAEASPDYLAHSSVLKKIDRVVSDSLFTLRIFRIF